MCIRLLKAGVSEGKVFFCHLVWSDSDFKLNLNKKNNLLKEGNHFPQIRCRWVHRDFEPLLSAWDNLTLCLLVSAFSPLCVCFILMCVHQWFMHMLRMNAYPGVYVCYFALTSPWWMSPSSLCACPSHPSRAVHLYMSETSIEIDSSDGMISEASTKDPSSSEDEGPSSDDDDDGGNSDWGGEGWGQNGETETLTSSRPGKLGGGMPRWNPWIPLFARVLLSGDEERAAAVTETSTLLKNVKKSESLKLSRQAQRDQSDAFWRRARLWNRTRSTITSGREVKTYTCEGSCRAYDRRSWLGHFP